jgi:LysM domain
MGAPSAVETPVAAVDARSAARLDDSGRGRPLRAVDASMPAFAVPAAAGSVAAAKPRSSSIASAASRRLPLEPGPNLTGPNLAGPNLAGPILDGPILTGTVVSGREPRFGSVGGAQPQRAPLRLTRRGRLVVTVLLVAAFSAAVLLLTALVSGRAQATNHGEPRAGYQGMHKIVVRPGQTMWSIAAAAEPTADPRSVVQEIMSANALDGPGITAGQLLWVP